MSLLPAPIEPVRPAFLTRVAPVTRLVVGFGWLLAAIATLDPIVPARLVLAAVVVLVLFSGLPLRRIPGRLAPLGVAIASLVLFSILFAAANGDPAQATAFRAGPLRIAWGAIENGVAIGLRVLVIALTTLLVFGPSDPTSLADSVVQQWHVPDRFAYGTLAAFRVAPFMAGDWATIGAARRVRGIAPRGLGGRVREAGGRLLVMLVAAIRRAERMALAMDARGFDCGIRRTHFRRIAVGPRDLVALAAGLAIAVAALQLPR